jgi:hypothetical protein
MDLVEVGACDVCHRAQSWQAWPCLSTDPARNLDDVSSEHDHDPNEHSVKFGTTRLGESGAGMDRSPTNPDALGSRGRPNEESRPRSGREADADDDADELVFETVIVPARLEAAVARRVAIASSREGISIADLLGRAAAAYDWQVADDSPPERREDR